MDVIGNLWWVWVAGTVVCTAVAFLNQVSRMKRLVDSGDPLDAFRGIGVVAIAGLGAMAFSILLAVSIIVNIIWAVR